MQFASDCATRIENFISYWFQPDPGQDEKSCYERIVKELLQACKSRANHPILIPNNEGQRRTYAIIFRKSESWKTVEKGFTEYENNTLYIPTPNRDVTNWIESSRTCISRMRALYEQIIDHSQKASSLLESSQSKMDVLNGIGITQIITMKQKNIEIELNLLKENLDKFEEKINKESIEINKKLSLYKKSFKKLNKKSFYKKKNLDNFKTEEFLLKVNKKMVFDIKEILDNFNNDKELPFLIKELFSEKKILDNFNNDKELLKEFKEEIENLKRNIIQFDECQKVVDFIRKNWDCLTVFADWHEVSIDQAKLNVQVRTSKVPFEEFGKHLNSSTKAIFEVVELIEEKPFKYHGLEPGTIYIPKGVTLKNSCYADSPKPRKRSSSVKLTDSLFFDNLYLDENPQEKNITSLSDKLINIVEGALKEVNKKLPDINKF